MSRIRQTETNFIGTAETDGEGPVLEQLYLDGLSANDDAAGLSGIPVDAVDRFQVVTGCSGFPNALP